MSEVIFPIVGSGRTDLLCVSCACLSPDDFPAGKVLVLGQNDQDIEHILADARHDEPGGPEITIPIRVRFKPNHFSGKSYGLALALADKRARYRRDDDQGDVRLWATGVVLPGGSGEIGSVSGIDDKLEAIAEEAKAGDIVVLPSPDIDLSDPAIRVKLERLASRAITCHAIGHLNEIAYLWSDNAAAPKTIISETGDCADTAPVEIPQSQSVDDTSDPVHGSKFAKLVIAALLLLIVLSVSALWFRSTLIKQSSTASEHICSTAELREKNEDEARDLLFSRPTDVPIEIGSGQESDLTMDNMLSSVRRGMKNVFEDKKFQVVPDDACAGVRLEIRKESETIEVAMLWSASRKSVFDGSDKLWAEKVVDDAGSLEFEQIGTVIARKILRRIFVKRHGE